MTTDDPILQELSAADPVAGALECDTAEADRVRRRVLAAGSGGAAGPAGRGGRRSRPAGTRTRRPWAVGLATVSLLVVAAVVVVAVTAGHHGRGVSTPGGRSVSLVYRLEPTPRASHVTSATIDREIAVIRARLAGEPVQVDFQRLGRRSLILELSGRHLTGAALAGIEQRATAPGALAVYDWEADALLPDGHTVASGLPVQDQRALTISQGGTDGAGMAGGMTRRDALALAARQPAGSHPGSVADRTVVLRAPNPLGGAGLTTARFFVLHDAPVMANRDITGARAASFAGEVQVALKLTARGARALQNVTAEIAHRGQRVSTGHDHLFQHFAIALDGNLVSVPQIDFTKYPDGVTALPHPAMEIPTGTAPQAREVAAVLRAGPLPLLLTPMGRAG